MVDEMRSVDELLRDLKFVAKYECDREYNEIDVGQLLDDAVIRIQSLVADVEDISRRYRSVAKDSVNLTILLGFLNRYLPRECDTCKHWVIGDETPMKCEVGGCEDLKKRENWEWGYKCRSDTLFSRVSRSPEDMAEFLLDKVILSPCEVICGGECSAIGNLEQTAMDQCKKKIIDFLNQDINNIENERN